MEKAAIATGDLEQVQRAQHSAKGVPVKRDPEQIGPYPGGRADRRRVFGGVGNPLRDKGQDGTVEPICSHLLEDVQGIPQAASCVGQAAIAVQRSEEHTSELQSLMRSSYAVFCLKKKKNRTNQTQAQHT